MEGDMTRWVVLVAAGALVGGVSIVRGAVPAGTPESLHTMASEYYRWRDQSYPVASSSQGLHTWDDRLTDYSGTAVVARRKHIAEIQTRVRSMPADGWAKDDRIDWLLFRSQIDTIEFFDRVLDPEATDLQVYVGECSNAIFSLLKKDYAPARTRALAATARLKGMPALLDQARTNLTRPVG